MVTSNLMIALAISLTGQVDDKVCYKKCTGHTDDVIKKARVDKLTVRTGNTVADYVEAKYDEDVYEWVCQGEAEGFKHSITNKLTCDGTNHEDWETEGKYGECYVCY
jgi:hypothetical protein